MIMPELTVLTALVGEGLGLLFHAVFEVLEYWFLAHGNLEYAGVTSVDD